MLSDILYYLKIAFFAVFLNTVRLLISIFYMKTGEMKVIFDFDKPIGPRIWVFFRGALLLYVVLVIYSIVKGKIVY